jgi:adenylate cyclase class IV
VHLDRVEGLGEFLELEVVLEEGESAEAGTAEAHALMARLGIGTEQLVQGAYVDLLNARSAAAD